MHRPPALRRVAVALVAGVLCLLAVLTATGLLVGRPVGAGDNGDGSRLYCGVGLVPATPDRNSNWKGGVVMRFDRDARCSDPMPSSAEPILRAAAYGSGSGWSLTRLGWLYALLAAAATALAAFAATGAGLARALVLLPILVPLAEPDFARFFLSTYSEPAGLLGAFVLVCGVAVIAVTGRVHRAERLIGLVLVAGGGLLATTAKAAYAPLLVTAFVVCAVVAVAVRRGGPRWSDRLVGPVIGVLAVVAVIAPLSAALSWQSRGYPGVNAYDLTFTTVLTEIPDATTALGLPGSAAEHAGDSYYLTPAPQDVPGAAIVLADPTRAQHTDWQQLAEHPAALLRSVGVAMEATEGRGLAYLPSAEWTPSTTPVKLGTIYGEQGASGPTLRAWLDGLTFPWWPAVLAALGVAVGIAGTIRRTRLWSSCARLAGVTALSAVGLATFAVLGDGYFEIAKHTWLAAYLLDVTALALLGALVTAATQAVRSARIRRHQPTATAGMVGVLASMPAESAASVGQPDTR
ncbi:MAG TPA: hypothetical protein VJ914_14775 [Pseudonocardiaceae bacterium]|nr:hypothetical protein [Pseudonocardiaceae bacterium]